MGMASRQSRSPWAALLALAVAAPALSGCLGIALGAGGTLASAVSQQRGVSGVVSDTVIRARINDRWFAHDVDMYRRVSLVVQDGRVLLTGRVPTREMRLDAVRLAWQADGVREVVNEIKVTDEGGIASFAADTWISSQLKAKILLDREISSLNYSIETVGGVVYLMGVARSRAELDRVTDYARNLRNVERVVSYVEVKDAPGSGAS